MEAEKGFDNKAVMGGLEQFIPAWEAESTRDAIPPDVRKAVTDFLHAYQSAQPEERSASVRSLLDVLRAYRSRRETPKSPHEKTDTPSSPPDGAITRHPTHQSHSPGTRMEKIGLNAPLTVLQGVGTQNAARLEKLGINTLGDLLHHYPRRYDDYSQLKTINQLHVGDEVTIVGVVQNIQTREIPRRRIKITEAIVTDNSGYIRVSWFNQPWLEKSIRQNMTIVLSGKVDIYLGRLTINSPDWESLDMEQLNTNRIVPVYPLTAKMTQKWIRKIIYKVLDYWAPKINEYIPSTTLARTGLLPLTDALKNIHFPETELLLNQSRKRLAFDEIFILQMGLLLQKQRWQSQPAISYPVTNHWLHHQIAQLPFQLTSAQNRVINEIQSDLSHEHPMNRLIQGDVGSGKTVVAAIAISMIAYHQKQTALMAPTSILAEQHYATMLNLLSQATDGILEKDQIALLVGSTPAKEKKRIRNGLQNGEISLVIGTHALLEDPIQFQSLQLVIIDEQHRFGVLQRAALREKGENPHLLVMTATPIPRSMALTVYGDLDISVMDEMPPGRKEIPTEVIVPGKREMVYEIIRGQLRQGRQAYVIYPLVEQGDNETTKAAVEEQERLQNEVFNDFKVGLMHGRLKPAEKDTVMDEFRKHELDILVSTSVVEVGVDVPNATIMVIEGANRFGLAQLHQFRGRVGRGVHQSYCYLLPETDDAVENERLQVMASTNDGFILAEKDLEQRGPGDFLGTRQSGYSGLRIASLTDSKLIEMARNQAKIIFADDPALAQPENQALKTEIYQWWSLEEGDQS